jgi:hypothetical protein
MSAPSVEPGQPSSQEPGPSPQEPGPSPQESEPGPSPSGHHGFHDLVKLAKVLALALGGLATLLIGIAIGNSARKRIDRMSHGIS